MTDKLRECPFCGGEARLRNRGMNTQNYVVCENCGTVSKITETEAEAIASWNTRRPMDRIVEQLEELAEDARLDYCPDSKYRDGCIENCQLCHVFAAIKIVKGAQNE